MYLRHIITVSILVWSASGYAGTLLIDKGLKRQSANRSLSFLRDDTGNLDLASVLNDFGAEHWQSADSGQTNLGFQKDPY
jgi:hypothetical protein